VTAVPLQKRPQIVASPGLKADLLAAIPSLRAFAMSLSGNMDRADDLVQETLMKAWSNLGSFTEGSNMSAWLFTILRNIFYSDYRKRRREVADPEGQIAAKLATVPAQSGHMDLLDFRQALQKLPADQREALILVGASGLSYEEAANICGCAVGTMKSRVNRARNRLADLLAVRSGGEYGNDPQWQASFEAASVRRFSRVE
jgi:RNA polymerase sigma-70 factor (ECF subfamily)